MARIKHTKNELRAQRETLVRFERFLPMLQLKKQQLQVEIQKVDAKISEEEEERNKLRSNLNKWIKLFSEPIDIENFISLTSINTEEENIAGVNIPIFSSITIKKEEPDLFSTPTWIDDALKILENLIRLRVKLEILLKQRRLISKELRTTSQRVNLFEKVKIPECKENIRIIKIFLGDEQTASVVRGKLAKRHRELVSSLSAIRS